MNPSLSMTLQEARSLTRLEYEFDMRNSNPEVQFFFEGNEAPSFRDRITRFISHITPHIPVLAHTSIRIESENTFPHSSGIASSASAMGALAMCLVHMENEIAGPSDQPALRKKASFIARLGSGSASRSIFPNFAVWGATEAYAGSGDEFAIPVTGYHETFSQLRDAILIVESGQKQVSSSAGHALMDSNPFSTIRFQQAHDNLYILKMALTSGDWNGFINLLEEEALTLHAMMMTGRPGYLLMKPGTLSILQKVREFRKDTGCRFGFTLDAGANVHLLYAREDEEQVAEFIHAELVQHCEDQKVIMDRMGPGPAPL